VSFSIPSRQQEGRQNKSLFQQFVIAPLIMRIFSRKNVGLFRNDGSRFYLQFGEISSQSSPKLARSIKKQTTKTEEPKKTPNSGRPII